MVLKERGGKSASIIDAIAFYPDNPEQWIGCSVVKLAYRLDINEFRNVRSAQLVVESIHRCD